MNPVFNTSSKETNWYRDKRSENRILTGLGILVLIALLFLVFKPADTISPDPALFMNQVQLFFQDSIRDFYLTDKNAFREDSLWVLEYEYPEKKLLREDLYRFGLFCGDHIKKCSVRKESDKNRYILTIRNKDGKTEGLIKLRQKSEIVKGQIVLIIDDFGYAYGATEKGFLELHPSVTFSVIPGHMYSKKLAQLAARKRHPVMIHMPMEPLKYGGGEEEYIIMTGMDRNEIEYRITKAITELPMARGMNNHMGSRVTGSAEMIHKIAEVLQNKNLFFVDSYTVNGTVVHAVMSAHDIRVYQRDIFLDHENSEENIRRQIGKMVRIAEKRGITVAIGHNRPLTLKILTEMIPKLEKDGFRFISPGEL